MDESEVREHVRVYLIVFTSLAVLTVVTVGLSYLDLATAPAIAVAMVVATVKAGLVAGFFMHLVSERKVIHWTLLLCFAFLVVLMLLPVATETGIEPLWPPTN